MKIVRETVNGIPLIRIADDTYHYAFDYYTTNKWLDEHRLVLSRSTHLLNGSFFSTCDVVLIDLEAETETVLIPNAIVRVVYGSKVYAIRHDDDLRTFVCLDTADNSLTELQRDISLMDDSLLTADGRYFVYRMQSTPAVCKRLDIQTGEAVELFRKEFAPPFYIANHYMVNPHNPDQVFFAHEGDTRYVSNRLWLFEKDKGMRCIAKQRLDEEGNLGDCFGHECWAPDGKGLWFVKYSCSPTPPRGICYVTTEGEQTDVLYGKYPYWHVACAPNNRYLVSDTQGPGYSSVVVVDKETGKEAEAYRAGFYRDHPAHPHPTFSPSSDQIIFHDLVGGENGQLTVGIMRVEDVLNQP